MLGVLVQANYGTRESLTIAGVPVGREIQGAERLRGQAAAQDRDGSIIVVVATDAPLLPHQLERLARRVPMGIARLGGTASNGSGDIFIAFSTANAGAAAETGITAINWLPNGDLTPFFDATVEATEEAIVNALVAAETMAGINGNTAAALPTDQLRAILTRYNRMPDSPGLPGRAFVATRSGSARRGSGDDRLLGLVSGRNDSGAGDPLTLATWGFQVATQHASGASGALSATRAFSRVRMSRASRSSSRSTGRRRS